MDALTLFRELSRRPELGAAGHSVLYGDGSTKTTVLHCELSTKDDDGLSNADGLRLRERQNMCEPSMG